MPPPERLDAAAAAEYVGDDVTERFIREAAARGEIEHIRLSNKRISYARAALDTWLARATVPATSEPTA